MSLNRTACLALGLLTALSAPAIAFTALVQRYVFDSGQTRILVEIGSEAYNNPNAPAGNYQQSGGSGGILTFNRGGSSGLSMRFRDTSGAERCIGRLTKTMAKALRPLGRSTARWKATAAPLWGALSR